jgi:hypothetical protein
MMQKPQRYEVQTDIEGNTITGRYEITDRMVTVFYRDSAKTTQIGGLAPDAIARLLLGELAREAS